MEVVILWAAEFNSGCQERISQAPGNGSQDGRVSTRIEANTS